LPQVLLKEITPIGNGINFCSGDLYQSIAILFRLLLKHFGHEQPTIVFCLKSAPFRAMFHRRILKSRCQGLRSGRVPIGRRPCIRGGRTVQERWWVEGVQRNTRRESKRLGWWWLKFSVSSADFTRDGSLQPTAKMCDP